MIKNPKLSEYDKQINFMKNPIPEFIDFIENRRINVIDSHIENDLFVKYQDQAMKNLIILKRRVTILKKILDSDQKYNDPSTFYVIKREG